MRSWTSKAWKWLQDFYADAKPIASIMVDAARMIGPMLFTSDEEMVDV